MTNVGRVGISLHPGCFNAVASTGILRRRLPIAAKIALATAGTMAEVPASPARRLEILHDVDVDGRRLVHAQDLVRVEVGLLDTPVLERDLAAPQPAFSAASARTASARGFLSSRASR